MVIFHSYDSFMIFYAPKYDRVGFDPSTIGKFHFSGPIFMGWGVSNNLREESAAHSRPEGNIVSAFLGHML